MTDHVEDLMIIRQQVRAAYDVVAAGRKRINQILAKVERDFTTSWKREFGAVPFKVFVEETSKGVCITLQHVECPGEYRLYMKHGVGWYVVDFYGLDYDRENLAVLIVPYPDELAPFPFKRLKAFIKAFTAGHPGVKVSFGNGRDSSYPGHEERLIKDRRSTPRSFKAIQLLHPKSVVTLVREGVTTDGKRKYCVVDVDGQRWAWWSDEPDQSLEGYMRTMVHYAREGTPEHMTFEALSLG